MFELNEDALNAKQVVAMMVGVMLLELLASNDGLAKDQK